MTNNTYINIGTENCCYFVNMSIFLIKQLEQNHNLYYAIEEALQCAENGHYMAGIITFAQLLNLFNEKTPEDRHLVAHQILQIRPTKESYEKMKKDFEEIATNVSKKEISECKDIVEYKKKVNISWRKLMQKLQ